MFETNELLNEAVDAVYKLTVGLDRGDILTHSAIVEVTGLTPNEGPWQHVTSKVRARLQRERGIATWFERGVGYRLLTVRETLVKLPVWRRKKARSQYKRLTRSQAALPDSELTVSERMLKHEQVKHDREEQRKLLAEIRDMERFATPWESRPTVPPTASLATPRKPSPLDILATKLRESSK